MVGAKIITHFHLVWQRFVGVGGDTKRPASLDQERVSAYWDRFVIGGLRIFDFRYGDALGLESDPG